eukprot:scaffold21668_cov20-Phaeocystis_antarctica.AAC.1
MQENEELRSRLYDTHNTLAAAGGEGASEEHWRELATLTRTRTRTRTLTLSLTLTRRELAMSIAKSADDEKAQILEALGKMREVTPNPNPDPNPNPQP